LGEGQNAGGKKTGLVCAIEKLIGVNAVKKMWGVFVGRVGKSNRKTPAEKQDGLCEI